MFDFCDARFSVGFPQDGGYGGAEELFGERTGAGEAWFSEEVAWAFENCDADVCGITVRRPFDFQFIDIGLDEAFGAVKVADAFTSHAKIVLNERESVGEWGGSAIASRADQHGGDAARFDGVVSFDGDAADGGFLSFADVDFEGSVLDDGGDIRVVEAVVLVEHAEVIGCVVGGSVWDVGVGILEVGGDSGKLFFDGVSKGLGLQFLVSDKRNLNFV